MPKETRITKAQRAILKRFTCERLTAHADNLRLTTRFYNHRNVGLAQTLRLDAWQEDQEGLPTVYYIVKSPEGEIAMYFSLKCGVLFDPNYVRDVLDRYDHNRELLEALADRDCQQWARDHVEELRRGQGFIPYQKKMNIRSDFFDAKQARRDIIGDEELEPNERMIRVDEALPAIELVHFCVNDRARREWAGYKMGHSMGEVLFWYFIVPKILQINRLIGCEYAYLFAADSSRDGTLINYYENVLHFDRLKHIGAIKPQYDFYCIFMAKRLFRLSEYRRHCLDKGRCDDEDFLGLADYRKDFFEYFNYVGDDLV